VKWFGAVFLGAEALRSMAFTNPSFQVIADPWWIFVGSTAASVLMAMLLPKFVEAPWRRWNKKKKMKRKVARLESELSEDRELDRLLAKINESGLDSLTPKEQEFLKRTSERMSKRN
jgi:hypothetical protein